MELIKTIGRICSLGEDPKGYLLKKKGKEKKKRKEKKKEKKEKRKEKKEKKLMKGKEKGGGSLSENPKGR